MPDNNISSSSSSTSNMPPPPNKKRKKSVTIAPSHPTQVALPPPLIPYPPPHLMPSYFPVYHQHPYFLSVGPQAPISPSLSPTLSSTSSTTATATTPATATATPTQRILPKSPTTTPTTAATAAISPPTLAPTFNFYPYPMQISPQLHPTAAAAAAAANAPPPSPVPFGIRHNSVSSTTSNSTADQREQARKVSHSAIERRRRERINDKILQLKDLIPSCSERENLHKMTILQSAIDYITYLKKVIEDSPSLTEEDYQQPLPDRLQKSNSMLPKEVDQLTNQFSAHPPKSQSETVTVSSANDTKSIESEEDVEVLEEEEDEENSWAMSTSNTDRSKKVNTSTSTVTPLPSSGLKPMDVIKLNKSANASSSSFSPLSPTVTPPAPPKIIVNSQEVVHEEEETTASYGHTERNMNLENILC
ncbi:unnamed protein product [Mucor circinelloides]